MVKRPSQLILLSGILLLAACIPTKDKTMFETVSFLTSDGVRIVGDYYAPKQPNGYAVLLSHMMPADRASWRKLAAVLQEQGLAVLAIDLRGHGDSWQGPDNKKLDYRVFSDQDHQASIKDLAVASQWLTTEQKIDTARQFVGGASIGANLSLVFMNQRPLISKGFFLSPGLDYRGVRTKSAIASLKTSQQVYLLASQEDEEAARAVEVLDKSFPAAKVFSGEGLGHGTTMLERKPELLVELAVWLKP